MDYDKTISNGTSNSASVGSVEFEGIHNSLISQPIQEQERTATSIPAAAGEAGEVLVEGGIWALTRDGGDAVTEKVAEYTGVAAESAIGYFGEAVAEVVSGVAVEAAGSVAAEVVCEAVAEGATSIIGEIIGGIISGIFDGL